MECLGKITRPKQEKKCLMLESVRHHGIKGKNIRPGTFHGTKELTGKEKLIERR